MTSLPPPPLPPPPVSGGSGGIGGIGGSGLASAWFVKVQVTCNTRRVSRIRTPPAITPSTMPPSQAMSISCHGRPPPTIPVCVIVYVPSGRWSVGWPLAVLGSPG